MDVPVPCKFSWESNSKNLSLWSHGPMWDIWVDAQSPGFVLAQHGHCGHFRPKQPSGNTVCVYVCVSLSVVLSFKQINDLRKKERPNSRTAFINAQYDHSKAQLPFFKKKMVFWFYSNRYFNSVKMVLTPTCVSLNTTLCFCPHTHYNFCFSFIFLLFNIFTCYFFENQVILMAVVSSLRGSDWIPLLFFTCTSSSRWEDLQSAWEMEIKDENKKCYLSFST